MCAHTQPHASDILYSYNIRKSSKTYLVQLVQSYQPKPSVSYFSRDIVPIKEQDVRIFVHFSSKLVNFHISVSFNTLLFFMLIIEVSLDLQSSRSFRLDPTL